MGKNLLLLVGLGLVLCLAVPSAVQADWYDSFADGDHENDPNLEDPNIWDVDDPNWWAVLVAGDSYLFGVDEGRLRITGFSAVLPFLFAGALVEDGLADPNTHFFDSSGSHYMIANVRTHDDNFEPNKGMTGLWIMSEFSTQWQAYAFEWEPGDGWMSITSYSGFTWMNLVDIGIGDATYPPSMLDPNDPNLPKDPMDPHWLLVQFDVNGANHDANHPDDPNDPNCHWIRGAAWMGGKYDWDGIWNLQLNMCGVMTPGHHVEDPLAGDFDFDPNIHWDYYYHGEGYHNVSAYSGGDAGEPGAYNADVSYDDFEVRWGDFTTTYRDLTLKVVNPTKGYVTIDPDILADLNDDPNDPNELRRYTDGTEVVLAATPTEGSWNHWKIFDPNYPGDSNYYSFDTNSVLYLTMDTDWSVEAQFKCGSSLPPFVAMSLLALAVGVVVRRFS